MKQIKQVVDIEHVTAVDFGTFSKLKASVLEKVKLSGKVPGGAAIKIGGADFSISAVHS